MSLKKRRKKRTKVSWVLVILALLLAGGYILLETNIKPALIALAKSRVEALAVYSMNQAVSDVLQNDYSYDDLVTISYAADGSITMIQANTTNMNRLSNAIVTKAQQAIEAVEQEGVGVALGTIIGGPIFSGKGPMIDVMVVPVGNVTTAFESNFEDAGINQTRHEIMMTLSASMSFVAPFSGTSMEVTNQVLVAENVIVGKVPQSYVNVQDDDQMLNLIPN